MPECEMCDLMDSYAASEANFTIREIKSLFIGPLSFHEFFLET